MSGSLIAFMKALSRPLKAPFFLWTTQNKFFSSFAPQLSSFCGLFLCHHSPTEPTIFSELFRSPYLNLKFQLEFLIARWTSPPGFPTVTYFSCSTMYMCFFKPVLHHVFLSIIATTIPSSQKSSHP